MNNSKIEWCDMTWNPVTGCFHGCPYCYARRIAERFGASATDHNSAEYAFRHLPPAWEHNFFLSAEPLLGGINLGALRDWPRWIIIGAMTGPGAKRSQPRRDWIDDIVKWADEHGLPVFMKDSLIPIVGEDGMRRDFPWTSKSD